MQLDDVLDDGQPETEPGEAPFRSLRPSLEDVRQKRRRDPLARVGYLDDRDRAVVRQTGFDQTAGRSELDGVGQKIREHLT